MHLYSMEVRKGDHRKIIYIEARNRDQAALKAIKQGWNEVCWVNMIG